MFDDIVEKEKINTGPSLMKEVCEKLGVKYIDSEDKEGIYYDLKNSKKERKEFEIDDSPDPTPEFDEEIQFECDTPETNVFADARRIMGEFIFNDEGLNLSYRSNIAMFLNDRCGITDYEERNKLAKELMNLIWC